MKIVVTAAQPSLEAAVDPRFGRCSYFLIVETDDLAFEAVENPNVALGGGAGIQSAQLMNEKGVRFVLTGNCGPNAHQTLSAAGVQVIVGCSGVARDVVEKFTAGQLHAANEPNVASHFGTGGPNADSQAPPSQQFPATGAAQQPPLAGMGMGRGRGGGQGQGMGRGGGRGRGMGRGMGGGGMGAGAWPPAPIPQTVLQPPQSGGKQDELSLLKQQAKAVGEQMRSIEERIRRLEEEEGS
ncbi:MAG: NifB/NifX family molybdenum-iron cluster-binding protein [Planctomycetes bacterium]|nr:NifB/NifX family molybdenum-iron cluster-binding protein [Planctomycetota bacterium]